MALKLEQKRSIVAELHQEAGKALAAVLADYRGMTVAQMTDLRAEARRRGLYLRVIRNTLAQRAMAGTKFECLDGEFKGPTLLAFSRQEPGAAARLLKDSVQQYEALKIKALSIDGQLLDASQIDRVASLPTREEALAQLLAIMLAPAAKLARTLNEVPGKLARTLAAVRDAKQAAG